MVLFDSSNITTLHEDSVNTNALLKSKVDTIGLKGNVSPQKTHGISKNADALNKKTSSPMKRNNSLKKKASSDLKNQNIASQNFNNVVNSIDSLKHSIESIRQTNDSIESILSNFTNKSENTLKAYCIIFLILGIVSVFFVII